MSSGMVCVKLASKASLFVVVAAEGPFRGRRTPACCCCPADFRFGHFAAARLPDPDGWNQPKPEASPACAPLEAVYLRRGAKMPNFAISSLESV